MAHYRVAAELDEDELKELNDKVQNNPNSNPRSSPPTLTPSLSLVMGLCPTFYLPAPTPDTNPNDKVERHTEQGDVVVLSGEEQWINMVQPQVPSTAQPSGPSPSPSRA